ncbi:MAG: TIGR00159 family protein [Tepidisphaera sp.]|nr:TIGR00159 family protein [Tepidisphaera sp.]
MRVLSGIWQRFEGLIGRIENYPPWEIILELLIIGVVVYAVVRFVQGTRAAGALKGLLLLVVFATIVSRVLAAGGAFARLSYLYDKFLALFAIALVVIFQPELRRALVRLGETPFLRVSPRETRIVVDEIAGAVTYLARAKFGALIVIERQIGLSGIVEGGTILNAQLSSRLLQTIFFPGSALHDLAVIIKDRTVRSAGVQLPLAEAADMPDPSLGSRHRAALGLSKECDAIIVVVSEETGTVRIAERGHLTDRMNAADLPAILEARLLAKPLPAPGAREAPAPQEDHHDPDAADLGAHALEHETAQAHEEPHDETKGPKARSA